jgi:hypothetical protein
MKNGMMELEIGVGKWNDGLWKRNDGTEKNRMTELEDGKTDN